MPDKDLLGQRLGPYVVRQRLGQGGMGTVYLAHDTSLDRLIALKVLDTHYTRDTQLIERFQREARAAAKLNHPNIVQIYSVDLESDPPYIVMEYVKGASIDKILATKGPFTWQQALTICGQVAAALACAHEQGIIHRDIKPGNILLDGNGRARVTDFGIAKVLGANTALTGEQVSIGSPAYMSPEQCGAGQVVPASDLFSLGITLFEALTGRVPYEAETYLGLIKQITLDPLPNMNDSNPDLPVVVQDFVEVLTAKSTGQRYAHAANVIEDLQSLRDGKPPRHLTGLRGRANESAVAVVAKPSGPADKNLWDGKALVDELLDGTHTATVRRIPRQDAAAGTPWAMAATVIGATLLGVVIAALALWRNPPPQSGGPQPPPLQDARPTPQPPSEKRPQPGTAPLGPPPPAPAGQPQPGQPGYVAPPGYPQAPPPGFPPPPPGAHYPPPGGGYPPPPPPGQGGFPPPPPPQTDFNERN